jgi:hypothetical protein
VRQAGRTGRTFGRIFFLTCSISDDLLLAFSASTASKRFQRLGMFGLGCVHSGSRCVQARSPRQVHKFCERKTMSYFPLRDRPETTDTTQATTRAEAHCDGATGSRACKGVWPLSATPQLPRLPPALPADRPRQRAVGSHARVSGPETRCQARWSSWRRAVARSNRCKGRHLTSRRETFRPRPRR